MNVLASACRTAALVALAALAPAILSAQTSPLALTDAYLLLALQGDAVVPVDASQATSSFTASPPDYSGEMASRRLVVWGVASYALCATIGSFIGLGLAEEANSDLIAFRRIMIGGLIGGSLCLPIGVHAANDDQGHLGLDVAASFVSGAGVLLFLVLLEKLSVSADGTFFLVPLTQLVTVIAVELKTSYR